MIRCDLCLKETEEMETLNETFQSKTLDIKHLCPRCVARSNVMLSQARLAVAPLFRRKLYRYRQKHLKLQEATTVTDVWFGFKNPKKYRGE